MRTFVRIISIWGTHFQGQLRSKGQTNNSKMHLYYNNQIKSSGVLYCLNKKTSHEMHEKLKIAVYNDRYLGIG